MQRVFSPVREHLRPKQKHGLDEMRIVARIDELFSVDAEARAHNLDHATRHLLRLERARPLLDVLKPQIEAARTEALPSSALGKAAQYTLALWRKLTRFLEYPELELSNNLAGRAQELDTHRQSASRTEDSGHSLHRRKLPSTQTSPS